MLPWPRLPALIRARYLTTLNRWPELLEAKVPAASLLVDHRGRPLPLDCCGRRSSVSSAWSTSLSRRSVTGTEAGGCSTCGEPTDRSRRRSFGYLGALARYVVPGLRRRSRGPSWTRLTSCCPLGPAVVVLDPELQVRSQTAGAAAALLQLNPPDEPMTPIPASAYNVAAALVAAEQGVPVGEPWARVHLGGSRWVTVKAARMAEAAGGPHGGEQRDIAVSIEPSTPTERTDLFARVHGLSARETEVLTLLGRRAFLARGRRPVGPLAAHGQRPCEGRAGEGRRSHATGAVVACPRRRLMAGDSTQGCQAGYSRR